MPFDFQPTLSGEQVTLRPLRQEDWEALFAVANDPLIWVQHPQPDRHKEEVFRAFFRRTLASGGALLVLDARTGAAIGSTRFSEYRPEQSEIEIGGTFLARAFWGGPYNREMKQLLLAHAFQFVDAAVFCVGIQNMRSQRALEKLGAHRCGTRPDDLGRPNILFKITRSGFIHFSAHC
jgi:N-acetyltransferase